MALAKWEDAGGTPKCVWPRTLAFSFRRFRFSRMSRAMTTMSIRTIAFCGVALLAVWYALLGGGRISAEPIDVAENPVGWLVGLGSLAADLGLLLVVRRVRRARRILPRREPLTPDDRMWSAHLAWLDECAVRARHERAAKAS